MDAIYAEVNATHWHTDIPRYVLCRGRTTTPKAGQSQAATDQLDQAHLLLQQDLVSDGIYKGELREVCKEPTCPGHHPNKQTPKADASFKVGQERLSLQ